MKTRQDIIIDDNLNRLAVGERENYLCHAYCHDGHATIKYNGKTFQFGKGDCMIIPGRGDLVEMEEKTSEDFRVEAIYITQEFIDLSTPPSNYGTRGHLSLFENPIMTLNPEQQQQCAENFAAIRRRLAQRHNFHRDIIICAVQTMILDFFDFHASLYGTEKISAQQHQLMQTFIELLERGDFRKNRDIGYYADMLCVTPKYLSEVCKKASGLPAAYWITRYTSLDISRQLRDRSRSISEISDMFGFSSLSHFSRYVQKNLGAKPSDFRE